MNLTARPHYPKLAGVLQPSHDFPEGQDRCAKCGMRRRAWEDTHAPCLERPVRDSSDQPASCASYKSGEKIDMAEI
jgi:hypothetical protein